MRVRGRDLTASISPREIVYTGDMLVLVRKIRDSLREDYSRNWVSEKLKYLLNLDLILVLAKNDEWGNIEKYDEVQH